MLCMLTLTNIFFHKMQNSTQPACLRKMHVFEICDLYEESRFNSLHKTLSHDNKTGHFSEPP